MKTWYELGEDDRKLVERCLVKVLKEIPYADGITLSDKAIDEWLRTVVLVLTTDPGNPGPLARIG